MMFWKRKPKPNIVPPPSPTIIGEQGPEHVVITLADADVAAAVRAQLLAAVVLGYCNGEARITREYLEAMPTVKVTTHTEPDGTVVITAIR